MATDGLIGMNSNSVFRWLEHPSLTPLLKTLIEESAPPLKAVETDFAVDSSGFSTSAFVHWYDERYGRHRHERRWVKVHLMCGVHIHVVTSVEVTPTDSADAPQFAGLVATTARRFPVQEVSADKAYLSLDNLQVVASIGAIAYIPFKQRTTGLRPDFDALWNRMWHYYMFQQETFLQHYHKRSNAETTFSMIKAKFGEVVRVRLPVAQVNEMLCKVLCHNLCVLIQSIYELGIEPTFWEVPSSSRTGGHDVSHVADLTM
jgi:transposase